MYIYIHICVCIYRHTRRYISDVHGKEWAGSECCLHCDTSQTTDLVMFPFDQTFLIPAAGQKRGVGIIVHFSLFPFHPTNHPVLKVS